jgi:Flp pilus assembly protein TadG
LISLALGKFGDRSTSTRSSRSSRGQAVVEFALVVPLLLIFFVAIADMARLYTTMMAVEAAAREAADFGAFRSSNWIGDETDPSTNRAKTVAGMIDRACTAASNLPDYVGPATGCVNPTFSYTLIGSNCSDPSNPANEPPCNVKVTLDHTFHLLVPLSLDIGNVHFGFPADLTFQRDSIFAISDLTLPP